MNNLKAIREQQGISQRELERRTETDGLNGIPSTTISAIENGRIAAYPSWRERIAAALGVTEAEIWPEEG